jgi:ADP-L-glycero-D-manno-heptose 6-epimerase
MIVVTGGAGFIGSAFVAQLNAHGISDILVVDEASSQPRQKNLANKSFTQFMGKDEFLSQVKANTLPSGITAIVHMGACSSTTEKNLEYLRANNLEYTKTLCLYATQRGIRFIYASSAATYGAGEHGYADDLSQLDQLKPLNPYGESKHLFDIWARDNGLLNRIVGLKFFNVYGPNEYYKGSMASVAFKAFNTITETGSFSLFKSNHPDYQDGEQMRDFVYVKDCCEVMWWLLQHSTVNGLFNLGSGKARSWNDLLKAAFSALGQPIQINYVEMPESIRNQYQNFTEAPMAKLRAAGYTNPLYSLEEGVTDYIKNYLLKSDQHW